MSHTTNSQLHSIGNASGSAELSRDGHVGIDPPVNVRDLGGPQFI
ncbi:MAG: hypothetical protein ACFFD9_06245 [Candidatus Thorarchaeota archaeon]